MWPSQRFGELCWSSSEEEGPPESGQNGTATRDVVMVDTVQPVLTSIECPHYHFVPEIMDAPLPHDCPRVWRL